MRNYQLLKLELVDALTARKSTTALSRKLGYSFDQVRRWQNGTKHLRWDEFCDLCEAVKAPLASVMRDLFGMTAVNKADLYRSVGPLKVFSQVKSVVALAKRQGVSLAVLKRYLAGQTFPDVEFVLELIDAREGFLDKFLDALKHPAQKNATIFSLPWVSSVSGAMAHPEHLAFPTYSPTWIARRLNLTQRQVEDAVKLMVDAGLIQQKPDGHFEPTLSRTIAIGNKIQPHEFARTIRFWTERAGKRYGTPTGEPRPHPSQTKDDIDRGLFRCFSTDPATAQKVSEILTRAEQEIHETLTSSTGKRTELRTLVLHHFDAGTGAEA